MKRYVDTQLRIFQRDLVRNQSRDSRAAMSEALANPGLAVNQLLKMKARGLITMEEFLELTAEAAGGRTRSRRGQSHSIRVLQMLTTC